MAADIQAEQPGQHRRRAGRLQHLAGKRRRRIPVFPVQQHASENEEQEQDRRDPGIVVLAIWRIAGRHEGKEAVVDLAEQEIFVPHLQDALPGYGIAQHRFDGTHAGFPRFRQVDGQQGKQGGQRHQHHRENARFLPDDLAPQFAPFGLGLPNEQEHEQEGREENEEPGDVEAGDAPRAQQERGGGAISRKTALPLFVERAQRMPHQQGDDRRKCDGRQLHALSMDGQVVTQGE